MEGRLIMQSREYYSWVDILKGLGIILVILGHLQVAPNLISYIYLFHMPLFFFVSGYLMNVNKFAKVTDFIKGKTKTLLLPYLGFSIISIICYSVFTGAEISIKESFICFIEGKRNFIYYNIALWFLVGIFVVELMYFLLKKYIKNDILIFLVSIFISFSAVVFLEVIQSPDWIWSIDTAFYYLVYFVIGNLLKSHQKKYSASNFVQKSIMYTIVFLSFSLNLILLLIPSKIQFVYSIINGKNEFLFVWLFICGLSGIVTYIVISKYLGKSSVLEFIGKNSLIIFTLHYPLGILIIDLLKVQLQIELPPSNIIGIIQMILILLLLKPVISIINNKFPFLIGNKLNFKS
ncbi:acyltransferase family protein [Lysinibacillus sp. LZ02]|uniref:acyltransferase family protein n=1 Tax=Lysinibacillus sp. LZ02 TaxID=3420668 RepID=UPI003D35C7A8